MENWRGVLHQEYTVFSLGNKRVSEEALPQKYGRLASVDGKSFNGRGLSIGEWGGAKYSNCVT